MRTGPHQWVPERILRCDRETRDVQQLDLQSSDEVARSIANRDSPSSP